MKKAVSRKNQIIPYGYHEVGKEEEQAVKKILRGRYLTQGNAVEEFEKSLCEFTNSRYAVVVSSGTAALHLAMISLCNPGDRILTSPLTFVATVNSISYANAIPVFNDVSIETYLLEPDLSMKYKGAIIVHFAGLPNTCNEWKNFDGWIVEDAAHSLGAERLVNNKWQQIGHSRYSIATILSFHPVKSITTCEGGAILTSDRNLADELRKLRSHCISSRKGYLYEIEKVGFNYRLSDLNCAIGIEQLKKLPKFMEKRREIAYRYIEELRNVEEIILPIEHEEVRSAWHLFPVRIKNRDRIYRQLLDNNIKCQVHYIPVYKFSLYKHLYKDLPNVEKIFASELSLPIFPALSKTQQNRVIEILKSNFLKTKR
ncbi:MAG: aminotransferase class I/II-fold pyridoxal phosphate-dependent enzyme [Candidatus Coatesbacteria bacterium]|nr:aminotransferase class I/II-fold pyridoxal phosphate-dependent enzyme [Candidatus Coatesbacteria bacterium]